MSARSLLIDHARPGAFLRVLCFGSLVLPMSGNAQSRHQLQPGREAAVLGAGVALNGFGLWQHHRNKSTPLPALDLALVPPIDRISTRQWHPRAHRTSNVLFGLSAAASLATAVIVQQGDRSLVPVVITMESGLLAAGLTNTVKELVRRPRPYLYNPDVPASLHPAGESALSFWSGHTANTAAITFSCASLVQRSDASNGMKTLTWIGAAALPMTMGYLRVRAGRHFPTDVLTGYLVGAAVGFAVPYFHRSSSRP